MGAQWELYEQAYLFSKVILLELKLPLITNYHSEIFWNRVAVQEKTVESRDQFIRRCTTLTCIANWVFGQAFFLILCPVLENIVYTYFHLLIFTRKYIFGG